MQSPQLDGNHMILQIATFTQKMLACRRLDGRYLRRDRMSTQQSINILPHIGKSLASREGGSIKKCAQSGKLLYKVRLYLVHIK